jgi:NAD(P)-dependent dehydrogenase (short-subunit alcohol dehydrogenase family)|tara:strand:+ start:675 stop:1325 length:651 start_codon:yes stop_codon:yes gene_type:complete
VSSCLIIGGNGGLGRQLIPILKPKYNIVAPGSKELDITDLNAVTDFFDKNSFDLVINMSCCNIDGFVHKLNQENFLKQIDVNIVGNVNLVSTALKHMRNRKWDTSGGNIILFSSILSDKAVAGTSMYSGCKGFIDSFVRTAAIENFNKNIYINSIQLGYFDGGLTDRIPDDILTQIEKSIPAGRLGNVWEIYNTIEYIVKTPYVSGSTIQVNGGLL